jgi:hypothetical protein
MPLVHGGHLGSLTRSSPKQSWGVQPRNQIDRDVLGLCGSNASTPDADGGEQSIDYECSYNAPTSLIQMRRPKPDRGDDRCGKCRVYRVVKYTGEYCEYETAVHELLRQTGGACQRNKYESFRRCLRHDLLRELKQETSLVRRDSRDLSKAGPLVHTQKRREERGDRKCLPNVRHDQTQVAWTQVSRKQPPGNDRNDRPLKGYRRGVE